MIYHDPSEYIKNLQQLLSSDKKRIGFLFGAGTSLVKNPNTNASYIAGIKELTAIIESKLSQYKDAFAEIRTEIETENKVYTVETLLSNLELKRQIIGNSRLNNLNRQDLTNLISGIKKEIHNQVNITDIDPARLIHADFAEWIKKFDRKTSVEVFTTNYDYLFEIAFEHKVLPYYDGFTGSYHPFFHGESVEDLGFLPNQTKLWKLHGSLGWHYDDALKQVLRETSDSKDILIYPSTLKYDQSRKQPYTALGDRFSNFIKQPDTVLITCGYSFGDDHINERIITALSANPLGHIYVLYYDIIWNKKQKRYGFTEDSALAKLAKENSKISVFATRYAVIGGKYGQWRLQRIPDKEDSINIDTYFDEDAHTDQEDKYKIEIEQKWMGTGELILPNFEKFVKFLSAMIIVPNRN
ncbi:MAG: SIR2 family protein [Treponema sp.]